MKYTFYLLILFAFPITSYCQSSKSERIILSKVAALPEVRSFMKTSRASEPQLMMEGTPGKGSKYYWVKVGLSNLDMFRTNFDFYVDPKTFKVYYLDTFTDSGVQLITLQQWGQWRKKAAWQKLHYYKHRAGKLIFLDK